LQTYEAKSSSSTKKWLLGCGIGCGVIVVILIIVATGVFFFIRNIVDEFKDTNAMMNTLTERYGKIKEFCPDPYGAISPDHLETFLIVRDAFAPARNDLGNALGALTQGKNANEVEVKKPANVFKMIKMGVGVIPQISEFYKSRNSALLEAEMGMGEYYYIYVVAYYSWLGKIPEQGPDFQLVERDRDMDYEDKEEFFEMRRDRTRRRINRIALPMLRNQYEKLTSGEIADVNKSWKETLIGEIRAMESNRFRLPWQDGMPEALEASLRPFRTDLEDRYSMMTNPLELALEQRRNQ
jgi:hypothetical protein